jgi:heat shock protein HtpX
MDPAVWQHHALINRLQTLLLLLVMMGLLALLGELLWGPDSIIMLIGMVALLFFINPSLSPNLIMRMYQAEPISAQQAPLLFSMLDTLSRRAQLEQGPRLYYIPSSMVNAFAVGHRNNAAIAITDGLLRKLDEEEIYGVLAHEISHIRSNDMRVMGLADMFSRLTQVLSLTGQLLFLVNLPLLVFGTAIISWWAIGILIMAPNINALAQLGLSRTREYHADLNAARLTGHPQALARALVKIEQLQGGWIERLTMPGRNIPEPSLLRTHPPTEERVKRLLELRLPPPSNEYDSALSGRELHHHKRPIAKKPSHRLHGLWY